MMVSMLLQTCIPVKGAPYVTYQMLVKNSQLQKLIQEIFDSLQNWTSILSTYVQMAEISITSPMQKLLWKSTPSQVNAVEVNALSPMAKKVCFFGNWVI